MSTATPPETTARDDSAVPESSGMASRSPARLVKLVGSRLLFAVVALFAVVTLSFLLVSLTPGDPVQVIAGDLATEEQLDALRTELGLDQSLWARYVDYIGALLSGDLGTSYYTSTSVAGEIADRLPATLTLTVLSMALAVIIGIAVGAAAGYFRSRWQDRILNSGVGFFQSIPDFFLGLVLIYAGFFLLGWAPAPVGQLDIIQLPPPSVTGFITIDAIIAGQWSVAASSLGHLVLPVLTLALVYAASFARIARSSIGSALNSQQVQYARALGLRERTVLRYALVEARSSVLTYGGIVFVTLFGGVAIVETVFAWEGLGQWALDGILGMDIPVVQGFVLVAGAITLTVYTLVDIAVAWLDPRISHG
ncbi:MAG: ABC transporter permease [Nocardiopsaceae bacterium]|nr:ABC transporter permease [Nocardiopsaceae bacterium]